jgi:deoxyribodipyrimidine photolyase-related protein
MNTIFLILPNQLFENNYKKIKEYKEVFLIEEPYFFSDIIKPNKIKIAYMKACMMYYYDDLKLNGINVIYKTFDEIIKNGYDFLKNKKIHLFDINDFKLTKKYKIFNLSKIYETPMFLLPKELLQKYNRKTPTHASFYEMSKNYLGILQDVKNQDVYNRKNPKINVKFNDKLSYITKSNLKYYQLGITYANSDLFKSHIGKPTLETLKIYPINSKDAYKAYTMFLNKNLKFFGLFQDVINDKNQFMYHAIISPMLNIGLLNPKKLILLIQKYKLLIDLSSYEGFIRQIIGWREYMRYLYLFKYDELIKSNNHKNYKNIDKSWYNASTDILIIDNEIKKAINYGYAHHIVRLMVFLNFLILNEINPNDIYKWFMEVISIDAYDWVMIPNIYSMGYFSSIGMKRPYLSSSNYILKMSNYKKNGSWELLWNMLFCNFVKSRKINFYLRSIK